jgi:hypothetical protein
MPDLIYGHLEQSRVDEDVRNLNEKWLEEMGNKGDVVEFPFGAKRGNEK